MKVLLAVALGALVGIAVLWLFLRLRRNRFQAEAETKLSLSEMMIAMKPEEQLHRRHGRRSSRRPNP